VSAAIKLSSPATREFWEIPVLFEDEHLLALDKPAGLLTSPDRHDTLRPNLMKLAARRHRRRQTVGARTQPDYLSNAHRPRRRTSGVMLLAKNKPALVALANLFSSEKPVKKYVALVAANPAGEKFEVDARLAPHPVKTGLMRVNQKDGKKSKTKFEVLENFRAGYCC
jgi:23S rRNA pseudouridine1911/1915/1917 synthase